jgi:hypothetical protein
MIALELVLVKGIGMTGFEPATSRSQSGCSTKLSYIPSFPLCMYIIPQIGGITKSEPIKETNNGFSMTMVTRCLI